MPDNDTKPAEHPKRIVWHCACYNARKAARSVTHYYDRMLAPTGINATQFTMLGSIAMLGPTRISEMADRLTLDRTTLTRNIKVLQKAGLVSVSRGGADKRERIVALTESGDATMAAATPLWRAAQEAVVGGLGEERWRRLQADLGALSDIADAVSGGPPGPA